jgi:hypothetical protein
VATQRLEPSADPPDPVRSATGEPHPDTPPRRRRHVPAWLAATAAAIVCGATGIVGTALVLADQPAPGAAVTAGQPLLLSSACPAALGMGEHDECVRELQRLLAAAGTTLAVDADFGPETRRRVTAFQVLAGIPPSGLADERTKRALYEGTVRMVSWSRAKVEQRIRSVFPEGPDTAVAIARCQSFLDPLWVLSNEDGSRNWGVFQIWDRRIAEMGGTQRLALDPEWSIQAARRLWSKHRDFRDWPACAAALKTG